MPRSNRPPAIAVEEYVAPFPEPIRTGISKLRSLIREVVPDCLEAVYPGWQLIGYRVPDGKTSRYFGFIAPFQDRVVLGFEYGAWMEDPHALLSGSGKQVRQVELGLDTEIAPEPIAELISQAVALALSRPVK